MKRITRRCGYVIISRLSLTLSVSLYLFAVTANGAVISTGDVDPDPPTTWTSSTKVKIGNFSDGAVTVTNGDAVTSYSAQIGYYSNKIGIVTVDGEDSTWNNSFYIDIGLVGDGTLNITNGGRVSSSQSRIANSSQSTSSVTIDGDGSILENTSSLTVSERGNGSLIITNGASAISGSGFIGDYYDSLGTVMVDGIGSTWDSGPALYVGNYGNADLNITNGALVSVEGETWVARNRSSSGVIHFDNGTLMTGTLLSSVDDLSGTGTINTNGLVSDIDLVFDASHSLQQTFNLNQNADQDITVNLDVDDFSALGAGYIGVGSMRISDGIHVRSETGYIGCKQGSAGTVTVDGAGSVWEIHSDEVNRFGRSPSQLSVGVFGNAVLRIINGGRVMTDNASIGGDSSTDSTGIVLVSGVGSAWNTANDLNVGTGRGGMLSITDGGLVTAVGRLTIANEDSWINMTDGGMLALLGQADGSLIDFLGLIGGTDAINYWDESISDWSDISLATMGEDYWLDHYTEGDLAGYTVLTVGVVPEPCTLSLIALGAFFAGRKKK